MQEPSGKARSLVASKLALDYRSGHFSPSEMAIADDIFRILIKDIEKRVRQSVAEQLCHSPNVPRDIVMKLVADEVDIAVHMLEFSKVLNDDDLLEIINSSEEVSRLKAIARRENVSARVAGELVMTHNSSVMHDLFKNKGAILTDQAMLSAWSDIAGNEALLDVLIERGGLSLTVVEKMLSAVSDDLKHRLIKQYKVSDPIALRATTDAREWELLSFIPANSNFDPSDDDQVEALVDQLQLSGRLSHSLLIRALCLGSLNLFETGLARLAGVPRVNARILLSDVGPLGFRSLYSAARMPEGFSEGIRVMLNISLEESDYGLQKTDDFRKRVIDRIYREGYHRSIDNMEYLLSIAGGTLAREHTN